MITINHFTRSSFLSGVGIIDILSCVTEDYHQYQFQNLKSPNCRFRQPGQVVGCVLTKYDVYFVKNTNSSAIFIYSLSTKIIQRRLNKRSFPGVFDSSQCDKTIFYFRLSRLGSDVLSQGSGGTSSPDKVLGSRRPTRTFPDKSRWWNISQDLHGIRNNNQIITLTCNIFAKNQPPYDGFKNIYRNLKYIFRRWIVDTRTMW